MFNMLSGNFFVRPFSCLKTCGFLTSVFEETAIYL